MRIKIPKEQAIKILNQRIKDLYDSDFNPKVWMDRTILDCKQIFDDYEHWYNVSTINFDTFIMTDKVKVLFEGKRTADKLLGSYIDYVQEYSSNERKQPNNEQNYQNQYDELLKKWNELVPRYNDLLNKQQIERQEISNCNIEIERLKSNTIQLENVSFKMLWTALLNLKIGQLLAVISTIIALLVGTFSLGTFYERTSANNELFDLKNSNKEYQIQNEKLKMRFDSLKTVTSIKPDTTVKH